MRLKRNAQGQIVESNFSMNGEEGIGKVPELVEEGNLYELTEVEDSKVVKDRQKAQAMGQLQKVNQVISYKNYMQQQAEQERRSQLLGEQMFHAKQKMHEVQNFRNNNLKAQAIKQGNMMTENLSGVSGYGLTADGRQPVLSRAAVDFQPIVMTDKAFGSYDKGDQWGQTMGLTVQVAHGATNLPPANQPAPLVGNLPGAFTAHHKFVIDTWNNNTWAAKYFYPNNVSQAWTKVFDENNKKSINQFNESYNTAKEVQAAAARGWMWSGWFKPNGSWVSVKVPYVYGLPMDNPSNPIVQNRNGWRKFNVLGTGTVRHPASKYTLGSDSYGSYFNLLQPVIEAFAVYYKHIVETKQQEVQQIEQSAVQAGGQAAQGAAFKSGQQAQGAMITAMESSVEQLLLKLKKGEITRREFMQKGGFNHPFLKYSVIRGK